MSEEQIGCVLYLKTKPTPGVHPTTIGAGGESSSKAVVFYGKWEDCDKTAVEYVKNLTNKGIKFEQVDFLINDDSATYSGTQVEIIKPCQT